MVLLKSLPRWKYTAEGSEKPGLNATHNMTWRDHKSTLLGPWRFGGRTRGKIAIDSPLNLA